MYLIIKQPENRSSPSADVLHASGTQTRRGIKETAEAVLFFWIVWYSKATGPQTGRCGPVAG